MKRLTKKILLISTAAVLLIGAPYIETTCDSGISGFFAIPGAILGCSGEKGEPGSRERVPAVEEKKLQADLKSEYKVTFIELGSLNCIPCRMMQPVMEQVQRDFRGQVNVVFHDVWTPQGKEKGIEFKIRAIPTQVFLDREGREFFRHEGFFPFDEIVKVLKRRGVK